MSPSTMFTVAVVVVLFASFAGTLAWAQQRVRPVRSAPAASFRTRRRPF
jgi:hypothetical protein